LGKGIGRWFEMDEDTQTVMGTHIVERDTRMAGKYK